MKVEKFKSKLIENDIKRNETKPEYSVFKMQIVFKIINVPVQVKSNSNNIL